MKIVIVDDHQLVAEGLAKMLGSQQGLDVIMTFNDAREAFSRLEILQPDLIITDLEMPGMNGEELITAVREAKLDIKIMLLTMFLDPSTVKRMMALNVDAYLLKNSDSQEFTCALRSLERGRRYYSSRVAEVLVDESKTLTRQVDEHPEIHYLTDREREVLKYIAEGLSSKEIAESMFISASTVETHRKALLRKLDAKNVATLVRIAVKSGLV